MTRDWISPPYGPLVVQVLTPAETVLTPLRINGRRKKEKCIYDAEICGP
jgi:hypothetical protein